MKYKIMLIRSKISFMALEKRMTIMELFADAIKKSYKQLVQAGHIQQTPRSEMIQKVLAKGRPGVFVKVVKINMVANGERMPPKRENLAISNEIKQILQKDQCMDIFKDAIIEKDNEKSHADFFKYKFTKKAKQIAYNKLSLMINLKMIKGIEYVQAILKRIQL